MFYFIGPDVSGIPIEVNYLVLNMLKAFNSGFLLSNS